MKRGAVVTVAALTITIASWLGPVKPHHAPPPSPPSFWSCPSGQHEIQVPAGLPECVR